MKYIIIAAFIFKSAIGFTQFSDSLVPDKTIMLEKFFSLNYGRLASINNYTEPSAFLAQLNNFRNHAYAQHGNSGDLQKKDIQAFSLLVLNQYINNYGIDTVKEEEFYAMLNQNEERDSLAEKKLDELAQARFVKKMESALKDSLQSLISNSLDINDSILFKSSRAFRDVVGNTINSFSERKFGGNSSPTRAVQIVTQQQVVDELIKDEFMHSYFSYNIIDDLLKDGEDASLIDSAYKKYMATAKNPEYRKKISGVYNNYKNYANGKPAPDFNYKDINGKAVSLKSLRGKYVYIDVWATWCGPCKGEIPYLIKLEESYKKKKIYFVSLSIDKMSDKPVWEKYVKTHDLKGIQIIADKEDFIQKFNINSIPRFILIGPDGNIVEADAKRPSDKTIRDDFDAML